MKIKMLSLYFCMKEQYYCVYAINRIYFHKKIEKKNLNL